MKFEKTYGIKDPLKLARWFDHEDGGSFFIAPLNNSKHIEENLKSIQINELKDGTLPNQTVYESKIKNCEVLSKTILLDWKGVVDNDDKEIKYTHETGLEVLYEYDEFRKWILDCAKQINTDNEEREKAIVKN